MPERQVYAIYMSFKKSGKFKTQAQLDALKKAYEPKNDCHQVTIDEFFGDLVEKRTENMDKHVNITDMWPEKLIKMEEN